MIGLRGGATFAASDGVRIVLHGKGGHGSRPDATVDPVVMAAATIMRLQTIVSRELAGTETAVVTVGKVAAGSASNVIPDDAELLLNIRSYDVGVRDRILAGIVASRRERRSLPAPRGSPTWSTSRRSRPS